MTKLQALLARLKSYQRELAVEASAQDGLPAASVLRRLADLENVIAAVDRVEAQERQRSP